MKGILLMLTFLTRIPIRISFEFKREDFIKGIVFVPFIGLIIGAILWTIAQLGSFIDKPIVILLIWTAYIWITGGLHIDGLADTVDGIFSNRSRDRVLEIMKDSRIGAFGVLSIFIVFAFNFVLGIYIDYKYFLLIPIVGRSCALLACSFSDYGRKEGLGKDFIENCGTKEGIIAFSFSSIVAILMGGYVPLFTVLLLIPITIMLTRYIKEKIGGMTGDTIGFVIETSQAIFIFLLYITNKLS